MKQINYQYIIKKNIKIIFYEIIIFLLKFSVFELFSRLFVNAYFMNRGYDFDFNYMKVKSSNHLYNGENILISKFDDLGIKNCIDIGSNKGDFSKEILKNKNTKVIAFEPLPFCSQHMKEIDQQYKPRFTHFGYALSNKEGLDSIYHGSEKNSSMASLEKKTNNIDYVGKINITTLKVQLKRLDSFIENKDFNKIDFIKIDTEGHEYKVLEGGLNFIKKNKIKIIQFEFNWHHLFTNNTIFQFSKILDNYNLMQLSLINGDLIQIDPNHYFSNIFKNSIFLLVEKEFFLENKKILLSN